MTPEEIERHNLDTNHPPLPSLKESIRLSLLISQDDNYWKKDIKHHKLTKLHNVISGLISKSTILSRQELDARDIHCPYWHAHFQTFIAISEAYKELDRRKAAKQQKLRLERAPERADKLDAAFHGLLTGIDIRDFHTPGERPIIEHDDGAAIEREYEVNEIYNKLRVLREETFKTASRLILFGNGNIERISHNGRDGNVWHQTFAERMGITWCTLTNHEPSQGIDFKKFLRASYELCGGSDGFDWTSTIDTICTRMACDIETPRKWPGKGGWDRFSSEEPWGGWERRAREESHEAKVARHHKRGHELNWAIDTLYNSRSNADKRDARLLLEGVYGIYPDTRDGRDAIERIIKSLQGYMKATEEPKPKKYPRPKSLDKSKLKKN